MISYEPLTQTLKERNMKRTDLLPYMSSATLAKLANNEFVSMKTVNTICRVLRCNVQDVAVYIEDEADAQSLEEQKQA